MATILEAIATKTIMLENIRKNTFMMWEMSTNAANKIRVKLFDDSGRIYVDNSTMGIGHRMLSD
jgi:formylmethanofuran dehydrogenase subunit B